MRCFADPASRDYARLTGGFYLIIAVAGAFAIGYVPSRIAAGGGSLMAHRGLFLSGIGADGVVMLAEVMATAMLYFMFRPVNATLAAAAALARIMMVAVMAAMLFFSAGALWLVDPTTAPASLDAAQRAELGALMRYLHDAGVWIWQLFFALHLALLGGLVTRSGLYPRLLGRAMSLGALGYLLDSLQGFAFPEAALLGWLRVGLLVVVTLAELGFALWLLLRGPRIAA